MGARGPLPKPAAERQNRNPHSLVVVPRDKPKLLAPRSPAGLLKTTRAVWQSFWSSDVAAAVDRSSDLGRLERWIADVDEWHRVAPVIRKNRLVTGSQGQPVLNPLAAYLVQIETRIAETEKRFGMDPASRSRLGLTAAQARLTAAQLNEMLNRSGGDEVDGEAEWVGDFTDG